MAQRITRAKRKIAAANIPYRVPRDHELPARLRGVLAVVYLVFTEGHLPGSGGDGIRDDLCAEAIRLGRVLRDADARRAGGRRAARPDAAHRRPSGGTAGCRGRARHARPTRTAALWDREAIAEGHALVRECLRRNRPGHYQLLAAVNAVHTDAATAADTDWAQVLALYDQLYAVTPTPVVALNRAVALAEVEGPGSRARRRRRPRPRRLPPVTTRPGPTSCAGSAARAEAAAAYDRALELATNPAERAFLTRRRAGLR